MLFNSYFFILFFLPVSVAGYYLCCRAGRRGLELLWLTALSFWFYGAAFYENGVFFWRWMLTLPVSIAVNYACARLMAVSKRKGLWLAAGLLTDLGLLFYCKYFNFFLDTCNTVFGTGFSLRELLLPLGISFFTFQQIAYLADCRQGKAEVYTPLEYVAYVTFFPKLSQGPLADHADLVAQFRDESRKRPDYTYLTKGLYRFALGLAKKVLLADVLGKVVALGYDAKESLGLVNGLLVLVCYSLQIYFDFSGYCDMAQGVANLLHLDLPVNFNSPYKSVNIADFWDRWHMTLTKFLTRYIYIPLGGSRKGRIRTYCNILIVFLVSGLWHGANWTFLCWGLVNGLFLMADRILGKWEEKIWKPLRVGGTFLVTTFAWSLFRSPDLASFGNMMKGIFSAAPSGIRTEFCEAINDLPEIRILCHLGLQRAVDLFPSAPLLLLVGGCLFGVFFLKNTQEKAEDTAYGKKRLLLTAALLFWGIVSLADVTTFLYFRF